MRRFAPLALAIPLAVAGVLAAPAQADSSFWEHGAWRVHMTDTGACELRTGGDGNGALLFSIGENGYDGVLSYIPVWFRHDPLPLDVYDEIALIFDGTPTWLSDEMAVLQGTDAFGEPTVEASMTNGFAAETVAALRDGDVVEIGVTHEGAFRIFDTYSLSGFTAVWLKAAEWCSFDPDALPASLS